MGERIETAQQLAKTYLPDDLLSAESEDTIDETFQKVMKVTGRLHGPCEEHLANLGKDIDDYLTQIAVFVSILEEINKQVVKKDLHWIQEEI